MNFGRISARGPHDSSRVPSHPASEVNRSFGERRLGPNLSPYRLLAPVSRNSTLRYPPDLRDYSTRDRKPRLDGGLVGCAFSFQRTGLRWDIPVPVEKQGIYRDFAHFFATNGDFRLINP